MFGFFCYFFLVACSVLSAASGQQYDDGVEGAKKDLRQRFSGICEHFAINALLGELYRVEVRLRGQDEEEIMEAKSDVVESFVLESAFAQRLKEDVIAPMEFESEDILDTMLRSVVSGVEAACVKASDVLKSNSSDVGEIHAATAEINRSYTQYVEYAKGQPLTCMTWPNLTQDLQEAYLSLRGSLETMLLGRRLRNEDDVVAFCRLGLGQVVLKAYNLLADSCVTSSQVQGFITQEIVPLSEALDSRFNAKW